MFTDEKIGWAAERDDVPIDVGNVARLLEPWRGSRPVTSATFLAGGLMNRNYRVRVGSDDVVLRFYDRDSRMCAKEIFLLRALRGRVAVPDVFYVASAAEPPFAVLEFVEGISLRDLKRTGATRGVSEAAYDAGLQLAALSSVRLAQPELLMDVSLDPALLAGPSANSRVIDHFLESSVLRERLGEQVAQRVHEFVWRRDDLSSIVSSGSTLTHGDFNAANILVRQSSSRWEVAAILDWEFAFAGSVFCDVGNFLRYERASNPRFEPFFSRGLTDGGTALPTEWRTVARLADLPALCELLGRSAAPAAVVDDVRELVIGTLDGRELLAT